MDIVDLIKDDHEQVAEVMDKIEATTADAAEERQSLFNELRNLLEAHTSAEERILYERLEDSDELDGFIMESYEEHTLVAELLESLSEMDMNNDEWLVKFKNLRDSVEDHVQKEETKVLPEVQNLISDEEREEMADDMKSLEDEIMSIGPGQVAQTPARSLTNTVV